MDLPRRVLWRAAAVAGATLFALCLWGLFQAEENIDAETRAAMALAGALWRVTATQQGSDDALVQAFRRQQGEPVLRHLALGLRDAQGQLRAGRTVGEQPGPALSTLSRWHRRFWPGADVPAEVLPLARPDGSTWSLVVTALPESERVEQLGELLEQLLILTLGGSLMLWALALAVRRGLHPLESVVSRLRALPLLAPSQGTSASALLPAWPAWPATQARELQAVTRALDDLHQALQASEAARQALAQKVLSLQEQERITLARELHDEFGQHTTALRLELAGLARVPDLPAPVQQALARLQTLAQHLQADVRQVLDRLAPLGQEPASWPRLEQALREMVAGWQPPAAEGGAAAPATQWVVDMPTCWPQAAPTQAMALAVYRMTQEAMTNVARHARAGQAGLRLAVDGAGLTWRVWDDGIGLDDVAAAMQRGTGLAGLRQRAWALQGQWQLGAWQAQVPGRPGTLIQAQLPWQTGGATR